MTATYLTATIDGNDFDVYADVAIADIYLSAEPSAATYRAADADTKARWAVSATRILNRQPWPGTKENDEQALVFGRTGTGWSGYVDGTIPQWLIDASCEMINALANGYDQNVPTTENSVKRQKAGSVEIEYFRGVGGDGTRFPLSVWELIAPYLSSDSGIAGSYSSGTCGESAFGCDYSPQNL